MRARRHHVEVPFAGDPRRAIAMAKEQLESERFEVVAESPTTLSAVYRGEAPRNSTRDVGSHLAGAQAIDIACTPSTIRAEARLTRVGWQVRVLVAPQITIAVVLAAVRSGWPDPSLWAVFAGVSLLGAPIVIRTVERRARAAIDQLVATTRARAITP